MKIRLWTPAGEQLRRIEPALANLFHEQFNSAPNWDESTWPLGTPEDHSSVWGTLRFLLSKGSIPVLASLEDGSVQLLEELPLVGFSLAGKMDQELVSSFHLDQYGAKAGDGLFSFAGISAKARGYRVTTDGRVLSGRGRENDSGYSLYRLLFEKRFSLPVIADCPVVWVRTRSCLPAVQHLASENGFTFIDRFEVDFHGNPQDRLVYRWDRQEAEAEFA